MSKQIQGVHHIALKPTKEQYDKTVDFYHNILGFETVCTWGDERYPCRMVSCGDNTCMEILLGETEPAGEGSLAHIAFATDKVDELIEKARQAGYPITVEPKDLVLAGNPVRVGFLLGPVGETVEFFWAK